MSVGEPRSARPSRGGEACGRGHPVCVLVFSFTVANPEVAPSLRAQARSLEQNMKRDSVGGGYGREH